MNITININAPELVGAINNLASALGGRPAPEGQATPFVPSQDVPVTQPTVPSSASAAQPTAVPTTAPTGQPTTAPTGQPTNVPTSAPEYTMEQLAVAATPLMDAGKQAELTQLLKQHFGVDALTQLPKERYGEFATALRQMGAKV